MGHVISDKGVLPDENKIKSIKNFPIPKSVKELKSFLGLSGYYRKFIKGYSQIAQPLFNLLKTDAKYIWETNQDKAFENLKSILVNKPILQYPDFKKTFIVTCDAVLSQGKIGTDLPISFASRTLNKAEKNYSATEKEMLAIVWAIKHFRPYLFGRKFIVVTDHKPLIWLFRVKDPGSRLLKWRIKLEEFDFEIIYKSGKMNTNADALSRFPTTTINLIETTENVDSSGDESDTNNNAEIEEIDKKDSEGKLKILSDFHNSPLPSKHSSMFIVQSTSN